MYTKKVTFALVVFALFVLVSAAPQIKAQTVKTTISIMNVAVDATSEAVDTGIQIMPGDSMKISGTGKTKHGETEVWTYEGRVSDKKIGGNFAFKNAEEFSLVGWIGDRKNSFQVSKPNTYPKDKSGTLFFAINDWSGKHYGNNAGGIIVTVELTRNYKIYADGSDATAAWGNGLVMINKGDKLSIAADGKVTYWEGGDPRDADGKIGSMATLLAPQINQSALIAKIGGGNPFKVGKHYPDSQMKESGWLYLSVNDEIKKTGAFTNNSGNLDVLVAVVRQLGEFKTPIK